MRITRSAVLVLLLISFAAPAYAAMDYVTWGGFGAIVPAFTNISNIFGSSDYHGMFTAFAIFGVLIGVLGGYLSILSGKQATPHLWAIQFLIGSLIYTGLFVQTDSLNVYDAVSNQNQTISGLPEGLVFVAGTINLVEQFVVQEFDTSANLPPNTGCGPLTQLNYADQGGAIGLSALQNSLTQTITDSNATQTLVKYVDDCVMFEMGRPGTTLTINTLLDPGCGGATAFLDTIGKAANPANYTLTYLEGNTQGTSVSCAQAFTDINNYYTNAANTNQAVQSACGSNNIADAGQCQSILGAMIGGSLGIAMDPGTFIAMNSVTAYTNQTLLNGGTTFASGSLTMVSQAQSGSSGGFTSGVMNPLMIDSFVAYSFMVFPIIALFIVTPLWRQAITLILSMLVWNALLRALDVVTFHMWVTQYQNALANSLNNSGMGVAAAMQLPQQATKYLGQYSTMRSYVFLFATTISGVLFKFSDSSLSRMAQNAMMQKSHIDKLMSDPNERGQQTIQNSAASARTIAMTQAMKDGVYNATNTIGQGMVANEFANAYDGAGKLKAADGNMSNLKDRHIMSGTVEDATKIAGSQGKLDGAGGSLQSLEQGVSSVASEQHQESVARAKAILDKGPGMASQVGATTGEESAGHAVGVGNPEKAGNTSRISAERTVAQAESFESVAENNGFSSAGQMESMLSTFDTQSRLGSTTGMLSALDTINQERAAHGLQPWSVEQAAQENAAFQGATQLSGTQRAMDLTGKAPAEAGVGFGAACMDNTALNVKANEQRIAALTDIASHDPKTANDPKFMQDGKLTPEGYNHMLGAVAGANVAPITDSRTGMVVSPKMDQDHNYVGKREQGTLSGENLKNYYNEIKDRKDLKNVAADVKHAMDHNQGFAISVDRDAAGKIINTTAQAGGESTRKDIETKQDGHNREHLNRDVTTIDQGLRKTAGSFIKTGYDNQEYNVNAKHGAYMMQVGGKEMMVQGDLYYSKNAKTGKSELIGGTIENGINQNVLAYQKDRDGNLHFAQVAGKADTKGNLIAGKASEITEQEFVRHNEHGAAVVNSRGTSGIRDVDVRGSSGSKMDQSSTQKSGTRVDSVQNLAGSAAQGAGFGQNGNINPGGVATMVAIGQGALHETAGVIRDVSGVSSAIRDPNPVLGGPGRAERTATAREELRTAEKAERQRQREEQH